MFICCPDAPQINVGMLKVYRTLGWSMTARALGNSKPYIQCVELLKDVGMVQL